MLARPSSALRGNDRFVARRRLRRRYALIAFGLISVLLFAGIIYELHQPFARISNIQVFGPPSLGSFGEASADQSFASIASEAMEGSYLGIIPRNSTFFFSESAIRTGIMNADSNIAAISMFRNGLTGLSIKINERVAIARWCGLAPTEGVDPYCYVFDASGFIFAAAASSTQTLNTFTLYAPLDGARGGPPAVSEVEPLRASVAAADKLPGVFDFARELKTFGSPVTHIILTGDEVHDYLASGTRVTYVLGNEQNAFTALVSARDNFSLADGSLEYVDLRFDRKMYLKRKK